jgi:hypothetical protein
VAGKNNASIRPLSGFVKKLIVNACTVPNLPMADRNAFELLHGFIKSSKWFVCEKTARPIFLQLLAVYHAKKTTLRKDFHA